MKYDGDVLQQYADQLYGKARRSIILHVLIGGFLGGAMGYMTFLVAVAWLFRSSSAAPYDEAGKGVHHRTAHRCSNILDYWCRQDLQAQAARADDTLLYADRAQHAKRIR